VLPLETVPNFSEGRDATLLDALGAALEHAGARVLDVHVDADHHRSVFTTVGGAAALEAGLLAAVELAAERIDLRRHDGVHPRIGAADVVPLVPLDESQRTDAEAVVARVAAGLADLGLPVFLYADSGGGRRPHDLRRGGPTVLSERIAAAELAPDHGPSQLHESAGAVILGVRAPLLAYNVLLESDRLAVAQAIAATIRERRCGRPGVRALGIALPRLGIVQVSMNVEQPERVPLWWLVELIRREAAVHGVALRGGELIGLMPAHVAASAARAYLQLPELDDGRLLEVAIQRAGL
jgi:glutamate formiminotransferase